jgi:hypothetical protein
MFVAIAPPTYSRPSLRIAPQYTAPPAAPVPSFAAAPLDNVISATPPWPAVPPTVV